MTVLRSGDAAAIREVLRKDQVLSPLLAPQVIDLLGQEGVAREAMHALAVAAPRIVGTILDTVLDERRDARVRRRAARLLRNVPSQRVVEGLVSGLSAESFDVRHSCARVLVGLKEKNDELRFDARFMFERARTQLEAASHDPRALEHAFDLLSLAGPREAMQLAYGALLSKDAFLRGVAREYLDVVLPVEVRTAMALRLSTPPPATSSPRTSDRALSDLLKSSEAIRQRLDDVRRTQDPDGEAFS
jgi:HEAT repeat protein